MSWETVIGLEVHVQLATNTKMFCRCPTVFGEGANTRVCPVCLGLPGALPVINREAVALAVRAGLAFGSEIAPLSKFDRKNYFYPDLPKAYQISQFDRPLCVGGAVPLDRNGGSLGLIRAHLEEDAGKLVHEGFGGDSGVDLNRCGTPLLEIVSKPDLRSPEDAYDYLVALKRLLRHIGVSNCDMEKGELRCDANLSVHHPGTPLGTRRELKNLNSFRAVRAALEWEEAHQIRALEAGKIIEQATLGWDADNERALVQRTKEDAHDYRYFPEPDLPQLALDAAFVREQTRRLPELPHHRLRRYVDTLGFNAKEAAALLDDLPLMDFYERAAALYQDDAKKVFNWVMQDFARFLSDHKLSADRSPITPEHLVGLIRVLDDGRLQKNKAKQCLALMMEAGADAETVIEDQGWKPFDLARLDEVVSQVLLGHDRMVVDYLGGKEKAFNGLLGRVMQATGGLCPPDDARRELARQLERRH